MTENDLTADYYWGKLMTAYRAFRDTWPTEDYYTADVSYDQIQAYRDYRAALAEWLRFCYSNE